MASLLSHKLLPSEHDEQATVMSWSEYYPSLKWLHAIPNGAHLAGNHQRRAAQMAKLKSEGLKTGVFDLFLPVARKGYHGLYIEMKRQKSGRVSDEQKTFSQDVSAEGYLCVVCNGATQAIEEIRHYMGIGRE